MLNVAQYNRQHEAEFVSIQTGFTQFAVCYTPRPGSALAAFGRSWFGRANDGTTHRAFSAPGLGGVPVGKITRTPDRYLGLHAPFFSPLRLRADARIEDVKARLVSFAAHRKPIEIGPLMLIRVRRSVVLRPAQCDEQIPLLHEARGGHRPQATRLPVPSLEPWVPWLKEFVPRASAWTGYRWSAPRLPPKTPKIQAHRRGFWAATPWPDNDCVLPSRAKTCGLPASVLTQASSSFGPFGAQGIPMPNYAEILAFLAENPPQLEGECELHASLLELLARCLRNEQVATDDDFADFGDITGISIN